MLLVNAVNTEGRPLEIFVKDGKMCIRDRGYTEYTYSAEKKGYSGTACWCREQPLAVTTGIGIEQHDHEGRDVYKRQVCIPLLHGLGCRRDGLRPARK